MGEFCEISSTDEIIRFQEDLPHARFSDGIILEVEFIEALE